MYMLVVLVHWVVCLVLILVILLQAGRGGGLSDMFSGALTQNQKLFGSETNTFLTKATSYSAILFLVTCVSLSVITTSRSKSLMRAGTLAPALGTAVETPPQPAPGAEGAPGGPAAGLGEKEAGVGGENPPAVPPPNVQDLPKQEVPVPLSDDAAAHESEESPPAAR